MKKLAPSLKRASPIFLTCVGAIGVIATAVTAVKATPKAMELIEKAGYEKGSDENPILDMEYTPLSFSETIKAAWKPYIPSMLIGAATIICIFGANGLNRRQQASIASAYALLDRTYKEYRNKVVSLYGKDADAKIREEVAKDCYEDHDDDLEPSGGKHLFFDEFSGEYFERTMLEVLDAEYQMNRTFVLEGRVKLNDFYEFLGLPKTKLGETVGWDIEDGISFYGYQWIEFDHELVTMDDGLECYILHIPYQPSLL